MKRYKVSIVDDHSVVTEGIRIILKGDSRLEVNGIFSDGNSLLNFLKSNSTEIIILDIDIPDGENFYILKQIKSQFPHIKVIIFTMHEGMHHFFEARKYGADSYILKTESVTFIPSVIMMCLKGKFYCSKELLNYLGNSSKKAALKPIEFEIINCLEKGLPYSEIAQKIGKSEKSVEYYIYKMRKKFGTQNNTELLTYIQKNYYN